MSRFERQVQAARTWACRSSSGVAGCELLSPNEVSELYDLIHPNASSTLTVRSLFVIDPAKKVRLIITYPASAGRNFNEILRVIDSLQLTDNHSVATPGNWQQGDDVVIVPSLQDPEVIKQKFPLGYRAVRPYLRLTLQPNVKR